MHATTWWLRPYFSNLAPVNFHLFPLSRMMMFLQMGCRNILYTLHLEHLIFLYTVLVIELWLFIVRCMYLFMSFQHFLFFPISSICNWKILWNLRGLQILSLFSVWLKLMFLFLYWCNMFISSLYNSSTLCCPYMIYFLHSSVFSVFMLLGWSDDVTESLCVFTCSLYVIFL